MVGVSAAASVMLLGCAAPWSAPQPARHAATPTRQVIFVGDSLTGGFFASRLDRSYPDLLVTRWKAGILARIGLMGAGAPGVLSAVSALPAHATDVIVEIGTNDFAAVKLPDFQSAYAALIAALVKREPNGHFICLGLWQGLIGTETDDPAAPYDQVVQAACPGRFVSLLPAFIDLRNHGPVQQATFHGPADWFHPNDRGHAAIASAIEEVA
jgi:lysophospholipase L1-like esterase